ncbi:MAG: DNA repair protein RadC, partial [Verrucomicrobiales bacterium]
LLAHYGGRLGQVAQCNLRELSNHRGLGLAKAAQILAALELGRRLGEERYAERGIHSPDDVFGALGPRIWTLSTEVLIAILLNARSRLIKIETISQGTLTEAAAHPREILRPAIAHSAYAFILVHNHPSGDPSPSRADRALTRRIREAAEIIGIHFHDHVIIGQPSAEGMPAYFSFAEEGMI